MVLLLMVLQQPAACVKCMQQRISLVQQNVLCNQLLTGC
jgi:hypothetical protein